MLTEHLLLRVLRQGDDAAGREGRRYGIDEHKVMIDRGHDLPIIKQAEVLRISRSGVY